MRYPSERLAELVEAEITGPPLGFVFFWRESVTTKGSAGPGCLSQFWPAPVAVEGVTYASAEHWMMAEKAREFGDAVAVEHVLRAETPQAAKSAGRGVRGFSEDRWAAVRYQIVVAGNLAKFSQHDDLLRYLASTGTQVLVEASPVDRIWGIGLEENDALARSPSRWRGMNLLGFSLMEVRDQLCEPLDRDGSVRSS